MGSPRQALSSAHRTAKLYTKVAAKANPARRLGSAPGRRIDPAFQPLRRTEGSVFPGSAATVASATTGLATTEFVAAVEAHGGTEVKQAPPNAFFHLPVLDESLEDILAKRAGNSAAAG